MFDTLSLLIIISTVLIFGSTTFSNILKGTLVLSNLKQNKRFKPALKMLNVLCWNMPVTEALLSASLSWSVWEYECVFMKKRQQNIRTGLKEIHASIRAKTQVTTQTLVQYKHTLWSRSLSLSLRVCVWFTVSCFLSMSESEFVQTIVVFHWVIYSPLSSASMIMIKLKAHYIQHSNCTEFIHVNGWTWVPEMNMLSMSRRERRKLSQLMKAPGLSDTR